MNEFKNFISLQLFVAIQLWFKLLGWTICLPGQLFLNPGLIYCQAQEIGFLLKSPYGFEMVGYLQWDHASGNLPITSFAEAG